MNSNLKLAIDASLNAGEIIMKYYRDDYEIKEKGYHNPVTTADNEADSFLKSELTNARPDYGWLSEETVDSEDRLGKERVWIVDPLDGTKEFIEGVPQFVVSVALVENGVPIIGVLHNPVTKETFYASKGNGTYFDDVIHNCSVKESTTDIVILNSRSETSKGLWEQHKQHFKKLKPIGSLAYKM